MSTQINQRAMVILGSGLGELQAISHALTGITKVMATIDLIKNNDPCQCCRKDHETLASGFVLSGLQEAIRILSGEICYQTERITAALDEEGIELFTVN